jgi:hypothetical protein
MVKCNRTACPITKEIDRMWWNTSTRAWYCQRCALRINRACHPLPIICFKHDNLEEIEHPFNKPQSHDLANL